MKNYKKLKDDTGNVLWDDFASYVNLKLFKKTVIKIAMREHEKTGRQVHVAEMFGRFIIFDSRERDDVNKSGRVAKMNLIELLKASIWNSNLKN
jgi:hypothetical protein